MARDRWPGRSWWLVWTTLLCLAAAAQARSLESPPQGADALSLTLRAEKALYGELTSIAFRLSVDAKRGSEPSVTRFHADYDALTRRSLVRVSEPEEAAGQAFLNLPPNLWTYEPEHELIRRVPPAELREPWLEGAFILDDFVRTSSLAQDYDRELLGVDPAPEGLPGRRAYVVRYRRSDAPPESREQSELWIDTEWELPLRREDYDAAGQLVRIVRFGGIRTLEERRYPTVWTAESATGEGRTSRVEIESVDFSAAMPASTFTAGNLKPAN